MPSNIIHRTKEEEYALCECPSSENKWRMEHDVRKLVQYIKEFQRMHVNDAVYYTYAYAYRSKPGTSQLWINMFFFRSMRVYAFL